MRLSTGAERSWVVNHPKYDSPLSLRKISAATDAEKQIDSFGEAFPTACAKTSVFSRSPPADR
jgi:hypothetical protein